MKRKSLWLALVAVVVVAAMGIAPAWAYFTDTSTASGGVPVKVTPDTDIKEWYQQGVKHVTITNSEDATSPVFVRARIYASGAFESVTASGEGWIGPDADGWYLYGTAEPGTIVDPGGETTELDVTIKFPKIKSETEPTAIVVPGDNYNVVVVYESTPVMYYPNGEPYADWEYILDSGEEQSGGE